jgi:prepilin-type N-terminal cleavage/methylation domain-containing protein
MLRQTRTKGFSLIEMLLVLAIIGILSGIAIPSYLGQRRRARVIGDALSNAKVLQMALESRKAENGVYGTASTDYVWNADGTGSGLALIPTFTPKGSSRMNYTVAVGATSITYTLTVIDPSISASTVAYQTDQTGKELARLQ